MDVEGVDCWSQLSGSRGCGICFGYGFVVVVVGLAAAVGSRASSMESRGLVLDSDGRWPCVEGEG